MIFANELKAHTGDDEKSEDSIDLKRFTGRRSYPKLSYKQLMNKRRNEVVIKDPYLILDKHLEINSNNLKTKAALKLSNYEKERKATIERLSRTNHFLLPSRD